MKKQFIGWFTVSIIILCLLPWLAITFAKSDAGMAITLLLFFGINPIYSIAAGIFAGRNIKKMWSLPIIIAALFLLGAWTSFDMGEFAFVIYAGIYLLMGTAAMFITFLVIKRTQE